MAKEYSWYDVVDSNEVLLQGDFISNCPIVIPPSKIEKDKEVEVRVIHYNVVVMSQSCDLIEKKLDLVLVSPVWDLNKFTAMDEGGYYTSKEGKEALRRGHVSGYHLLDKCELDEFKTNYLVVDFRSVHSIPFKFIIELAKERGERLRLLSPFREHLSQAFARFFMRVGLPADIPPFK